MSTNVLSTISSSLSPYHLGLNVIDSGHGESDGMYYGESDGMYYVYVERSSYHHILFEIRVLSAFHSMALAVDGIDISDCTY